MLMSAEESRVQICGTSYLDNDNSHGGGLGISSDNGRYSSSLVLTWDIYSVGGHGAQLGKKYRYRNKGFYSNSVRPWCSTREKM